MKKPNILFIFTDDHRFNTLSALGNTEVETPNLDRLAAQGTAFTHAYIMGASSPAVCMPSRAMMLTGRTLNSIEGSGYRIPPEQTTMPEWFRSHGYATAHIGKWHQDRASHHRSFSTGAKIYGFRKKQGWYEACNGHWHIPVHDYDPTGKYDPQGGYNDPEVTPFPPPFETTKKEGEGRHSVEVFTDAAIDFIQEYPKSKDAEAGKPFFLYLAHIAPHDPRQYPERLRERYHSDSVSLPENFATKHPFDNGDLLGRDELLASHPRRPEEVKQHLADYYALISFIDEHVGRVLDSLEKSGQAKNTIIVFAGDNGLALGQHGLMGKQSLYDHSIRVPLIFAGPGIPQGQTSDAWCYLSDIFPTLCDLTGLPIPKTVEGKSLVPAIENPTSEIRDTLLFGYMGWQRAVRVGDFKLIEYVVDGKRNTQLFDVKADPLERVNLASAPEHEETLVSLRKELTRWQTELGDDKELGKQFWSGY